MSNEATCKDCGRSLANRNSWEGLCYDCALEVGLVDPAVPGERNLPVTEKTEYGH